MRGPMEGREARLCEQGRAEGQEGMRCHWTLVWRSAFLYFGSQSDPTATALRTDCAATGAVQAQHGGPALLEHDGSRRQESGTGQKAETSRGEGGARRGPCQPICLTRVREGPLTLGRVPFPSVVAPAHPMKRLRGRARALMLASERARRQDGDAGWIDQGRASDGGRIATVGEVVHAGSNQHYTHCVVDCTSGTVLSTHQPRRPLSAKEHQADARWKGGGWIRLAHAVPGASTACRTGHRNTRDGHDGPPARLLCAG